MKGHIDMKANIYLVDGFETAEALVPADIFRRAGIDTTLISCTGEEIVTSAQNIAIKVDRLYDVNGMDAEATDVVFLPGGPGYAKLKEVEGLRNIVEKQIASGKLVAAICAAPSILGEWGMLNGKNATCFPGFEGDLKGAKVLTSPARVVSDGNILTARGMGTATDLALEIISHLTTSDTAEELGVELQYIDK